MSASTPQQFGYPSPPGSSEAGAGSSADTTTSSPQVASGSANPMRLWGGRFAGGPAQALAALSVSVHFDWRLAVYDLRASRAHARGLHSAGLLTTDELNRMLGGLAALEQDVRTGAFTPTPEDEDVHTALERGLVERLGVLGGKLRAARSRNDQVATDLRLYLRDAAKGLASAINALQLALIDQAERHVDSVAPGFTHLQHAQPVSFGHELAKHVQALARDVDRLRDWNARAAECPLGAGALSGSSLNVDPVMTAAELGFSRPMANSIDAVSDRDFAVEFLFVATLLGVHLSRLGEEFCLWASAEFGWAELSDAFSTGSSIMPQKKNPDIAELARGKAGRLIGNLTGLLATLKALPFAYNRDLQEDKEPVFDAVDTLAMVLPALTGLVVTTTFRRERMEASATTGHALATEIAEELVRRKVPFRQAHELSGQCVRLAEQQGVDVKDLSEEQLLAVSPTLMSGMHSVLSARAAIAARHAWGGTSPERVREQLAQLRQDIATGGFSG